MAFHLFRTAAPGRAARFIAALLWLAATGCSGSQPYSWITELPLAKSGLAEDRIGAGDLIAVRVYAQEAMSARGRVRPDGRFALPLLGDIQVGDKRPAELAKEIESSLKQGGFIVAPSVTVFIEESAPINVTFIGEVHHQGTRRNGDRAEVLRIRFRYDDLVQGEPHAVSFRLRTGDVVLVE
jgi:polysaccharide export outer membrane protein